MSEKKPKKIGTFNFDEIEKRCSPTIVKKVRGRYPIYWVFILILMILGGVFVPLLIYGAESVIEFKNLNIVKSTQAYMPNSTIPIRYDPISGNMTYLSSENISAVKINSLQILVFDENALKMLENNDTYFVVFMAMHSMTQRLTALLPREIFDNELYNKTIDSTAMFIFDEMGYLNIDTGVIVRIPRTSALTGKRYAFVTIGLEITDVNNDQYHFPVFTSVNLAELQRDYQIQYGTLELTLEHIVYNATAMDNWLRSGDFFSLLVSFPAKGIMNIVHDSFKNLFLSPTEF